MKTCHKCGHNKPITEYHRTNKSRDGRRTECKTCVAERARERRRNNPAVREAEQRRDRERRRAKGLHTREDGAAPRIHPIHGCIYPGCHQDEAVQHLCAIHHHEVTKGNEGAPLALTGGHWVKGRNGVAEWVAA